MNGLVPCVVLDFISSRMKAEGDVKEAGLEGTENLRMGSPHLRTARGLENHLATIHTQCLRDDLKSLLWQACRVDLYGFAKFTLMR